MTKFRMRKKPAKPKRKEIEVKSDVAYVGSVQDLIWTIESSVPEGVVVYTKDIIFDDIGGFEESVVIARFKYLETDDMYNKRLSAYNTKLNSYNKWFKDNKENIDKYNKDKADKEAKRCEAEKKRLQKVIDNLIAKSNKL